MIDQSHAPQADQDARVLGTASATTSPHASDKPTAMHPRNLLWWLLLAVALII